MSVDPSDRTHPASPIQLNQARTVGDTPRSSELAASIQNFGGLLTIALCAGGIVVWLRQWTQSTWTRTSQLQEEQLIQGGQTLLIELAQQLAWPLGLLFLSGVAGFWLQTGIQFKPERVALDLSRLGPSRWQNQNWKASFIKFLLSPLKLVLCLVVLGFLLWHHRYPLAELATGGPLAGSSQAIGMGLRIGFLVALVLFCFSVLDYLVERMAHRERWEMSEQQMRDEERLENGNPLVRSHREQRQRNLTDARRQQPTD